MAMKPLFCVWQTVKKYEEDEEKIVRGIYRFRKGVRKILKMTSLEKKCPEIVIV